MQAIDNMSSMSTMSTDDPFSKSPDLSIEITTIIVTVNIVALVGVISVFGIASNVINILVFCKQGFSETTNISYTALALSDMLSLVSSVCLSIVWNPLFLNSGLPLVFVDIQTVFAALPFGCFSRITGCLTAFITFERCLCVVWPLKIKRIISSTVVIALNISIYLIIFLIMVPWYWTVMLGWIPDPGTNRTILGAIRVENAELASNITNSLHSTIQIFNFFAVLVCTVALIIGIRQNNSWRMQLTKAQNATKKMTKRQDKAIHIVTLIAVLYVVCYLPTIICLALPVLHSSFIPKGSYKNVFFAIWSFAVLCRVSNSSVNIFVYYHMSSKFKQTCDETLKMFLASVKMKAKDMTTEITVMKL